MAQVRELTTDGRGNTTSDKQVDVPDEIFISDAQRTTAINALQQLENADSQWGALTAAQKDAANRLAIRVCSRLIRLVLSP